MATTTATPATTTWNIDPAHSSAEFKVKHMMISNVKGRFERISGSLTWDESDITKSSVEANIDAATINTNDAQRDGHLKSADFFHVEQHPTMTFQSSGVRQHGDDFLLDGDLNLRGVTKPVTFKLEVNGFGPDAYGGTRAGFSATTEINRNDWGVSYNGPIPGGGVAVSEKVTINLEIEAVLDKGE